MSFKYERRINYYETDKMGVVHHSNYARFLEEARGYFMEEYDMPYAPLEEKGVMIPVLGMNLKFKHHVTFDDTIVISLFVKDFNGVRLTMGYEVTNKANGEIVLTGETKHCFTNMDLKPIRLQKTVPAYFQKFMELKEENQK